MTRIPTDGGPPRPPGPSAPEEAPPGVTGTAPSPASELFGVLEASFASGVATPKDPDAIARVVVDSWMQRNVPTRGWPDGMKQALRDRLGEMLRDDPMFQSMLKKLTS